MSKGTELFPFKRGLAPLCLSDPTKTAKWTDDWVKAAATPKKFSWHPNTNQGLVVKAAERDTKDHCAYCDQWIPVPKTIDHFVPKSVDRTLAYDWNNLYLCCGDCQKRGNRHDPLLVRPDEPGYVFEDFFYRDLEQNLLPLPGDNFARAKCTIELFQLNKEGRRLQHKRRKALKTKRSTPFHDRDFRYMFPEDLPTESSAA